jgi:hypothetical protein
MQKLKRYDLEFNSTLKHLEICCKGVNILCEQLLNLNFALGTFFTLLPNKIDVTKLLEFQWGGKTKSLKDEVSYFIQKQISVNEDWSCIFDDFDADFKDKNGNSLYGLCGLHLNDQIYYCVNKNNSTSALISKCMQYSDAGWHSVCVLTSANLCDIIDQKLTLSKAREIANKTQMLILGAYDGEGYIFWERNNERRKIGLIV